jgi:hypothetical protein
MHHDLIQSLVAYTALFVVLGFLGCANSQPSSLPVSKSDHTTKWWGDDIDYGPREHFVHVIRDANGTIKEVYRYYLDKNGRPVLDGIRDIRRSQGDAGLIIEYKDGRIVRKYPAIITT